MRIVRLTSTILFASTLITAAACSGGGYSSGPSGGGNTPPPPSGSSVTVSNDRFTPAELTVAAGTTVGWTWNTCSGGDQYGAGQTCVDHNVTFDQGASSETKSSGTFSRTFPTAGTFPYHCTIHGPAMSGRVIVQ